MQLNIRADILSAGTLPGYTSQSASFHRRSYRHSSGVGTAVCFTSVVQPGDIARAPECQRKPAALFFAKGYCLHGPQRLPEGLPQIMQCGNGSSNPVCTVIFSAIQNGIYM
ncbi:hypothetical protein D3C75_1003830 [compost metagenome]